MASHDGTLLQRKTERYKRYGARGIKVCDEWHNVEKFIKWAEDNGFEKSYH